MNNETISFTLSLAGLRVGVKIHYEYVSMLCRDYLDDTGGEPDLTVEVTEQDIRREALRDGCTDPLGDYRVPSWESLALFRKIAEAIQGFDTLLIHGSVVAVDDRAFLFTAPSGTGKSTHTALWREHFGSRAVMVNDDKPLIRLTADGALACGDPWNGKHRLGSNIQVPLKGICFLERGEVNRIRRLTSEEAFSYVYRQTYHPQDRSALAVTLSLLSRLLAEVPVYRMDVNNFAGDAVSVAWEGMGGSL